MVIVLAAGGYKQETRGCCMKGRFTHALYRRHYSFFSCSSPTPRLSAWRFAASRHPQFLLLLQRLRGEDSTALTSNIIHVLPSRTRNSPLLEQGSTPISTRTAHKRFGPSDTCRSKRPLIISASRELWRTEPKKKDVWLKSGGDLLISPRCHFTLFGYLGHFARVTSGPSYRRADVPYQ